MAIWVIVGAAILGFILRMLRVSAIRAWILGSLIVPIFVLVVEFILPYQGGGASMWPIAIVIGGAYGAIASAVGVFAAGLIAPMPSDDA